MKLIALVFYVLFGFAKADILCDDYYGCNNKRISAEEPITVSEPMPHFTIYKSSGSISKRTFSKLHHVEALYIEASNITFIEDGALCNFPRLTKLQITFNPMMPKLTKKLLGNCFSVKSLSVSGNFMEDDTLGNMGNLETINLDDSNIPASLCSSSHLKTVTIENIKNLNLTRNHMRRCTSLKELNIAKIGGINEDALIDLRNLNSLDLYQVPLPSLSAYIFIGLSSLKYLALEDCKILWIADETFDVLRNLNYLSITFADASINWRHFQYLNSLEELVLKQPLEVNTLHQFSRSFLPQLKTLTVEVNDLSFVEVRTVRWNLPDLKRLIFYGSSNVCYDKRLVKSLKTRNSQNFQIQTEDGPAAYGFC